MLPFLVRNILFALALLLVAVLFLMQSAGKTAAQIQPILAIEAESAAVTGPVAIGDDTAASGGRYVEFASAATASVPTPSATPLATFLPAFPGAEGFGAKATGGRGGRIIEVMNLDDSGPGSLREAVEASGPRIVVFRVGGTIVLKSGLFITNPRITIAGQTAPGGGITLKNDSANDDAPIVIETHDVIIRGVRSRPGASSFLSAQGDSFLIRRGAYNVILDHCSGSWGKDENFNMWDDSHDITIQWSIFSEGLLNSTHEKGAHSKGMILGSAGSYSISVHHNLFAHNKNRTPAIKTSSGVVDVVNNVVYNHGSSGDGAGSVNDEYGRVSVNYVNNYFKAGPDSIDSPFYQIMYINSSDQGIALYVKGNIGPHRPNDTEPEDAVVHPDARPHLVSAPHAAPAVTTSSAFDAFNQVLKKAGVTVPIRDAVDLRIINDVIGGTGRIIDDPSEVGGWPQLDAGVPPSDSDHDGMPDDWETARGLNPDEDDSAGDRDGDGYTNVEQYINGLVPR